MVRGRAEGRRNGPRREPPKVEKKESPVSRPPRCLACSPRSPAAPACPGRPYAKATADALADRAAFAPAAHVEKRDFGRYKFLLNLPGSVSGSYSRNLNHLWALGAVVLLWRADFKEWYSPLLKSGVTHLDVDAETAAKVAELLRGSDGAARALAGNARALFVDALGPEGARRRWSAVLAGFRERFGFAATGDLEAALLNLEKFLRGGGGRHHRVQ